MNKFFSIIWVIFSFFVIFNNVAYASEWKEIKTDDIKKLNLKVYLNTKIYKCENNYIFYLVRYKGKEIGDYTNSICSNRNDYSSVILETNKFSKDYTPQYPNIVDITDDFIKLDKQSLLNSIVPIACKEFNSNKISIRKNKINNTETGVKTAKVEKKNYKTNSSGENIFAKFFKGVGKVCEFILIIPLAILFALLGS